MSQNFGQPNPKLTSAIKRLTAQGKPTEVVKYLPHALESMGERGFDHDQVMTCLRRGVAHGPEPQNGELRANVIHRGLSIRVVVRGIDGVENGVSQLQTITVVTVIEAK